MATLDNRYTINGLLDTTQTVMQNLEAICAACNTWLTYDSIEGKWSFVVNQAGTAQAIFDDDNILGGINLSTAESGNFYNQCEVRYRNSELRDQEDYVFLETPANQRLANEPDNRLIIDAPLVNNQIQAQIIGLIELKQSRLEQIIEFTTDYSQIGLDAGDIVTVTNAVSGFNQRLFRVLRMTEREENNSIVIQVTAQEYNPAVYDLSDLFEYISEKQDGVFVFNPLRDAPPITPFTQVVDENGEPVGDFGDFGELTGLLAGVAATGLINSLVSDGTAVTGNVSVVPGDNMTITADSGNNTLTFSSTGGGGGPTVVTRTIANITQADPAVVTTSQAHEFINGQSITITDVVGMTQVNGNTYYASILTGTTFALYTDAELTTPVDSTGFDAYTSDGVVTAVIAAAGGGGPYTPLVAGIGSGGLVPNQTNTNFTFSTNTPESLFKIDEISNLVLQVWFSVAESSQDGPDFPGNLDGTDVDTFFRHSISIVDQTGAVVVSDGSTNRLKTIRYLRPMESAHATLLINNLPAGTYGVQIGGAIGAMPAGVGVDVKISWAVYSRYTTNPF